MIARKNTAAANPSSSLLSREALGGAGSRGNGPLPSRETVGGTSNGATAARSNPHATTSDEDTIVVDVSRTALRQSQSTSASSIAARHTLTTSDPSARTNAVSGSNPQSASRSSAQASDTRGSSNQSQGQSYSLPSARTAGQSLATNTDNVSTWSSMHGSRPYGTLRFPTYLKPTDTASKIIQKAGSASTTTSLASTSATVSTPSSSSDPSLKRKSASTDSVSVAEIPA
jgi:hypothetical protein